MNIQQLEYILAVDTYRHFAKAAEHCRVTQPTLSMMIQKLEDELGVKLFDRNTQPVSPTPAGRKVIDQARVVLYQTSLIKEIVNEEEQSLKGTFRLAVLPTIAPYLLPRFFQQLSEKHPDLDIRIKEMQTAPTLKALIDGKIDAAIIANQPTENLLQGETLYYEQFYAYIACNENLFKKNLVRSSDVSGERLWLLDEGHCFRDQLMRFCQMEKVKLRQAAYQLGSLETFMRMVEGGNGITFIPELAIYQLSDQQKELVRPFAIPRPAREIVWVTRKDFIRHTIANLQSLAYAESHGVHAVLTDGRNEARVISGHIRIPKKPGFYLSVFAYGGECRGVSEIGVRYPLRDAVLSVNFPLGVSNEIVDDCAEIEVREGRLLVILSGKEREEAEA